jgi:gamma-glutamyltranspeptidase / glutathione hydrolase
LPVTQLLSKNWAAQRAKLINEEHANCNPTAGELREDTDTTYLSVVDREGNMVSLIQSNASAFGSGILAPGTGFVLHNRGALFVLDPSSPNALAGHRRPLHTIIPGFAKKGEVRVAFGIMGGWNQPQAHAQFVANFVDFKMNIQAALEAPRFTQYDFTGCDVMMEDRFPQKTREELTLKGHQIKLLGAFSSTVGGGQVCFAILPQG